MNASHQPTTFARRLGALLYDAIAVTTVLYFAAFIPVLVAGDVLTPGNLLFRLYLVLIMFAYFCISWTHGRTLGMQVWKIEIQTITGGRPDLRACALRFGGAALSALPFALGYLAALVDGDKRTWHDRLSGTRLLRSVT